eukprot:75652_1
MTKKVCLAIDVNLCNYNEQLGENCKYEHTAMGINTGIPQAPIPKGWYTKKGHGKYIECDEKEIVFDKSDQTKKFLYEPPSATPIGSDDIEKWGEYAPYNRFVNLVQSNIVRFYEGSIDEFKERKLTPNFAGAWPAISYSNYVRDELNQFHKTYGPHLADIERHLCRMMRYSNTLKSIKQHQRVEYFKIMSNKIGIIIKNRWNIDNEVVNEDIQQLHREFGGAYDQDDFLVLLKAFLKWVPKKVMKLWVTKNRDSLLLDESKWICKKCGNMVEDEVDDDGNDVPHCACEICFDWYHFLCIGIDGNILKDKKSIFLCRDHSGTGQFVCRPKKGFKYK